MAFSNVAILLRIHSAGYISIKELLALHNKKEERNVKVANAGGLFEPT